MVLYEERVTDHVMIDPPLRFFEWVWFCRRVSRRRTWSWRRPEFDRRQIDTPAQADVELAGDMELIKDPRGSSPPFEQAGRTVAISTWVH